MLQRYNLFLLQLYVKMATSYLTSPQLNYFATPTTIIPNTVNKNTQESLFTDSARSSSFSAPVAITPKNTDFHADELTLKDFFIYKIFYLCNEVISNQEYVEQVLADTNINSKTSKLNPKVELLEKENMLLRRIVINKEIIIQNYLLTKI